MKTEHIIKTADAYLDANWETIVDDIAKVVEVPSFEELDQAKPGAPFGPGPKAALEQALSIASRLGFETIDFDGYMGAADLKGETDTQLGIIGHMDVVPAGSGWHFEPYTVSIKEGYLVGRGVIDDKGPSMVALHAMKCLADLAANPESGVKLPYTVRFLFGANEETGMADVTYYRAHNADPAFLFTPDAEFPVCYGEKGGYDGLITSALITNGALVELEGGVATNAVPGQAHAIVSIKALDGPNGVELKQAENIQFEWVDEHTLRIDATGKSAHASTPDLGVNAIAVLVDYLLSNNLCTTKERAFLEFDQKLLSHADGSGIGIAASDDYFGALTVIGGTIKLNTSADGTRILQSLDSRFPTSITPEEITKRIGELLTPLGATLENTLTMEPFLVKPDRPTIQTLLHAYNAITGEEAKPFTMGGATYAREFSSGASFGPEMPWVKAPDWAGSMHGPDEAASIDLLKTAFKIYVLALCGLESLSAEELSQK